MGVGREGGAHMWPTPAAGTGGLQGNNSKPFPTNTHTHAHTHNLTCRSAHSCSWYRWLGLELEKDMLRSSLAAAHISRRWGENVGLTRKRLSLIFWRTVMKCLCRTPCACGCVWRRGGCGGGGARGWGGAGCGGGARWYLCMPRRVCTPTGAYARTQRSAARTAHTHLVPAPE